jgi:Ni/Co efflux regulator RcnB
MRTLILTALLGALALPVAAQADTSRRELARDRANIHEERSEYRDALRNGSRGAIREERREYRDAVREYRDDRRDFHRDFRRDRWAMNHRYGDGRGYQRYRSGYDMPRGYWGDRYTVNYGHYARPGRDLRWVRYYDDLLLINRRNGRVIDVRYDVY